MSKTGNALPPDSNVSKNLLEVKDLIVEFGAGRGRTVHAVSGISFNLARKETLGLVGESGCGKSTTARAIVGLLEHRSGSVMFDGQELTTLNRSEFRAIRPRMQVVFQDPISSLNPKRRVKDIVGDPLVVWGRKAERSELVAKCLEAVGLDPRLIGDRMPHQLSGGQCQRVSIARALVLEPELLICDEPVSSLDVSVQAQVLNLLEDLKAEYGLTMLFVAHDLGVVRNVTDRTAVMYLGKLCEILPSEMIFEAPLHPYTARLAAASDGSASEGTTVEVSVDEIPSAIAPPSGCRFRTRCPRALSLCAAEEPIMRELLPGHYVACHNPMNAEAEHVARDLTPVAGEC